MQFHAPKKCGQKLITTSWTLKRLSVWMLKYCANMNYVISEIKAVGVVSRKWRRMCNVISNIWLIIWHVIHTKAFGQWYYPSSLGIFVHVEVSNLGFSFFAMRSSGDKESRSRENQVETSTEQSSQQLLRVHSCHLKQACTEYLHLFEPTSTNWTWWTQCVLQHVLQQTLVCDPKASWV